MWHDTVADDDHSVNKHWVYSTFDQKKKSDISENIIQLEKCNSIKIDSFNVCKYK